MGHSISAFILRGEYDSNRAAEFGLRPITLKFDLTMFPLDARNCDDWADQLSMPGFVSDRPLLNCRAVHHIIEQIAPSTVFAIIETDYFGGVGQQSAAVYQRGKELMPPSTAYRGPINEALRLLGVPRFVDDPFSVIGLHNYRDWDTLIDRGS